MSLPFESAQHIKAAAPDAGARPEDSYWLTRFLFLRLLGLVYVVAFAIVVNQWQPLLGAHGLLPARELLDGVAASHGRTLGTFLSERGKIIPARITGNCARHQRRLTASIKQARTVALLPYTTVYP